MHPLCHCNAVDPTGRIDGGKEIVASPAACAAGGEGSAACTVAVHVGVGTGFREVSIRSTAMLSHMQTVGEGHGPLCVVSQSSL